MLLDCSRAESSTKSFATAPRQALQASRMSEFNFYSRIVMMSSRAEKALKETNIGVARFVCER
jgi:hypothetical protein